MVAERESPRGHDETKIKRGRGRPPNSRVARLMEQHGISRATAYRVIKRMQEAVEIASWWQGMTPQEQQHRLARMQSMDAPRDHGGTKPRGVMYRFTVEGGVDLLIEGYSIPVDWAA